MKLNFPVENEAKSQRLLAMMEEGFYPTAEGGPVPKQAPIYGMASIPDPAELILPGPGAKDVVATNPQRQEQLRRLRPMWRY